MVGVSDAELKQMTQEERVTALGMRTEQLTGKTLIVRSIEVAEQGTFYRVLAGSFDKYNEAQDFCTQLGARGQYCVVQRLSKDHDRHPGAATFDL